MGAVHQGKASLSNAPKRPYSRRPDSHFNLTNGISQVVMKVGNVVDIVNVIYPFKMVTRSTFFSHVHN